MSTIGRRRIRGIISNFLGRLLSRCIEVTPLIGESLDRRLRFRERITMQFHLLTCIACRNYLSNLKVMRDIFEKTVLYEAPNVGEGLSDEARARIRRTLENNSRGLS